MGTELVIAYRLAWSNSRNNGMVMLKLRDGWTEQLNVDDPAEFAAMAAILRERPVFYGATLGHCSPRRNQ